MRILHADQHERGRGEDHELRREDRFAESAGQEGRDGRCGCWDSIRSKDISNPNPYFGALIGRYANRIGHAQFTFDGVLYKVPKNNGDNSLHGGPRGFDKVVWTAREMPDGGLELTYLSKDGEEGYPGNCKVTVRYHLTDANELKIEYSATTDKDTVINLTNHSYFNLKGGGDILGHMLTLNADRFTPVDARADSDGRVAGGGGDSVRFSEGDGDWRADRAERRAVEARQRLRP